MIFRICIFFFPIICLLIGCWLGSRPSLASIYRDIARSHRDTARAYRNIAITYERAAKASLDRIEKLVERIDLE
ncbi:MAG: hypothetical protein PHH54_06225 [Candidatus Nanoarchaeia archaeon]|nr:hypothetical protein [Candidatus Nanoarchaeia archaeon]MDD5741551.1 hypothetical protein [Candidatus Nanoarchaeia archaeon]